MKSGKQQMTEGIELPNQEKIRMLGEKETYKYLGILEADTIKLEYFRRMRKLFETKWYSWNLIETPRLSPLVRYSGPFLKWTREEKQMDRRTRLYGSRKEGEREFTRI